MSDESYSPRELLRELERYKRENGRFPTANDVKRSNAFPEPVVFYRVFQRELGRHSWRSVREAYEVWEESGEVVEWAWDSDSRVSAKELEQVDAGEL